jgi:hypothetical protein
MLVPVLPARSLCQHSVRVGTSSPSGPATWQTGTVSAHVESCWHAGDTTVTR